MKPTLLIAEGDAELRDTYQKFLRQSGYEVEGAADGLDCLEKLRGLRPAVLILDRMLYWGGADGVLAWLREESGPLGVAVILTATAGLSPKVVADIEPPVVKYLPKPFGLATLLESVRAALAITAPDQPLYLTRKASRSDHFIG